MTFIGYSFQLITDARFGGTKEQLEEMTQDLEGKISDLGPVCSLISQSSIYELDWGDHKQWRKSYLIRKSSRVVTWDRVFGVINSIKPVPYTRVMI